MLKLGFSSANAKIEATCSENMVRPFSKLRSRFASSVSTGALTFDVDIDDFLTNLFELAAWPSDDDVRWQHELLTLVETNADDADTIDSRLRGLSPEADEEQPLLGSRWIASLTDFQARDVSKLLNLNHGANFSVPGAGKTRVALATYEGSRLRRQVERLVVVCPKSAYESWRDEIVLCFGTDAVKVDFWNAPSPLAPEVSLINYERLPDALSSILHLFHTARTMLVLDEAHRTKLGSRGAWGSATLAIGPYAARRLILTGTPAPNGAADIENLFGFVWPGQGRVRVRSAIESASLKEASRRLSPLYTRTTKAELGLPPVSIAVRRLKLPDLHREVYSALLGQFEGARASGGDLSRFGKVALYLLMAATTPALLSVGSSRHEPLVHQVRPLQAPPNSTLNELMRDLPAYEMSPKFEEVISIVAKNAALGKKTLVWSTFVRSLTTLRSLLSRYQPALVHGGTQDREAQLSRFRTDPKCWVLLSNAATLGEGVSLHQVCHDAVYVDRDFAAGKYLQSLDRIHRLGLSADVETNVTILTADGTIDEVVERRLEIKLEFMGGLLDDAAVTNLVDLDEEPSEAAGLSRDDLHLLMEHLRADAAK
ncbi:SNF2-related protein [Rhodococcoides kroppenstedtii]|uniref:SNF2-related protein n=1 Tax=Rhodococcoides kroppenstedtii TaxID=293050 RepID=UPI001BDDCEF8|nr:DEAD/DEAH box helicase [Rhodococcus kroppenstedtii]